MSDFSFVGASYVAASLTQNDQECINWYPEIDPTKSDNNPATPDDRGVIALYPCPGLVTRVQLIAGQVRGFGVLPGGMTLLAVSANKLYSITPSYVATVIGTLNTGAGQVYITNNGTAAYITDGQFRYTYTWGTGVFAVVTDGPFNGGGVCGEVDNFIFYNRPGTNQWGCTDVSAITSNALNLGAMLGASGNLVNIFADHRQILLLGERYSERWINVGSFPFPFAIIPGSSMQHGTTAPDSVARLGEGIAFLATDNRGTATVALWGAATPQPQRISTFAVENAIQGYAFTNDAVGYSYAQAGHEFYVITFPTADVTWCYDLATQLWHKRAWRDSHGVLHRHRSNCAVSFGEDIVVGDWQNGKLYAFSQSTYTDAVGETPSIIPCIRRCRHLTTDLKRQYFSDLQIQFQPGIGLQSGQGSNPKCILRWSNDGGFTMGNDHLLTIGKVGKYKHRAIKRRLGSARDRVFEVEVTDPVYRVIVSANINATPGAS